MTKEKQYKLSELFITSCADNVYNEVIGRYEKQGLSLLESRRIDHLITFLIFKK